MKFYLVRRSGSMGCVFDFSDIKLVSQEDLFKVGFPISNPHIEYRCYDNRLGLHAWLMIADFDDYDGQAVGWIYSTTKQHAWLGDSEVKQEQRHL